MDLLRKRFDSESDQLQEWQRCARLLRARLSAKDKRRFLRKLEAQAELVDAGILALQQEQSRTAEQKERAVDMRLRAVEGSFLVLRLPALQVELPSDKAVPYDRNAIVFDKGEIESLNARIVSLGRQRDALERKGLEERTRVESDLVELSRLELEVRAALVEALALTRLKVSKKLQSVIAKRDEKLMENEERNLKKQIDKLVASTEKLVAASKKKEAVLKAEIAQLRNENEALARQGAQIEQSVSQKQEVFDIVFGKSQSAQLADSAEANEGRKRMSERYDDKRFSKTLDLIGNRRLYENAKELAKEIEKLMGELRELQKRTYPSIG